MPERARRAILRGSLLLPWRTIALTAIAIVLLRLVHAITGVPQFVSDLELDGVAQPQIESGFVWERWILVVAIALVLYVPAFVRMSRAQVLALCLVCPVVAEVIFRRDFLARGVRLYSVGFSIAAIVSFLVPMGLLGLVCYLVWGRRTGGALVPQPPQPLPVWITMSIVIGVAVALAGSLSGDDSLLRLLLAPSHLVAGALHLKSWLHWHGSVFVITFAFYAFAMMGLGMDIQAMRREPVPRDHA